VLVLKLDHTNNFKNDTLKTTISFKKKVQYHISNFIVKLLKLYF